MKTDDRGGVGEGFVTANGVFAAGECFVTVSCVTGVTLLLYCVCARRDECAIRLVTRDAWSFAKKAVPYAVHTLSCWYVSLLFANVAASSRPVMEFTSEHYVASKVVLNFAAAAVKIYMPRVRSAPARTALFVGYLMLIATSEAMCPRTPGPVVPNAAVAVPLFWLTLLILAAPSDAYRTLSRHWKIFSLVYGLTTGICQSWYRTVVGKDAAPVFDAFLLVLVVHVQLVCLSVSYFAEGQQTLNHIAGEGEYDPMVASLDMYIIVYSIMQGIDAYKSMARPPPRYR